MYTREVTTNDLLLQYVVILGKKRNSEMAEFFNFLFSNTK